MEPIRTCIICKKRDLKENLQRFSFRLARRSLGEGGEGKIILDPRKIVGRGFYVHSEHQATEENLLEIWRRKKK